MKIGDEYKCSACGETYLCEWDDDEVWEEAGDNGFGDIPKLDMAIICDDCYKSMGFS